MLSISLFCCAGRRRANSLLKKSGGEIRSAAHKKMSAPLKKQSWGGTHGRTEALYHLRGAIPADFHQLHQSLRNGGGRRANLGRAWADAGRSRLPALVVPVALRSA